MYVLYCFLLFIYDVPKVYLYCASPKLHLYTSLVVVHKRLEWWGCNYGFQILLHLHSCSCIEWNIGSSRLTFEDSIWLICNKLVNLQIRRKPLMRMQTLTLATLGTFFLKAFIAKIYRSIRYAKLSFSRAIADYLNFFNFLQLLLF